MKAVALALVISCAMLWTVPALAGTEVGPLLPQKLEVKIIAPAWPAEVSEPYDDIQLTGSICLKPDLQQAMLTQLLWAKKFPELADKVAEAQAKRDTLVANSYIATQKVAHDIEVAQVKATRPSWLRATLYIGGALVFGLTAGYVAGKVLP